MMFNSHSTKRIALLACEQVGLRVPDLQLIRLGENALFRVPAEGVVVRIARTNRETVVDGRPLADWIAERDVSVRRFNILSGVADRASERIARRPHPRHRRPHSGRQLGDRAQLRRS